MTHKEVRLELNHLLELTEEQITFLKNECLLEPSISWAGHTWGAVTPKEPWKQDLLDKKIILEGRDETYNINPAIYNLYNSYFFGEKTYWFEVRIND